MRAFDIDEQLTEPLVDACFNDRCSECQTAAEQKQYAPRQISRHRPIKQTTLLSSCWNQEEQHGSKHRNGAVRHQFQKCKVFKNETAQYPHRRCKKEDDEYQFLLFCRLTQRFKFLIDDFSAT